MIVFAPNNRMNQHRTGSHKRTSRASRCRSSRVHSSAPIAPPPSDGKKLMIASNMVRNDKVRVSCSGMCCQTVRRVNKPTSRYGKHGHSTTNRSKGISTGKSLTSPRWLPCFFMICGYTQTYLCTYFKTTIFGEKNNVWWFKRIF